MWYLEFALTDYIRVAPYYLFSRITSLMRQESYWLTGMDRGTRVSVKTKLLRHGLQPSGFLADRYIEGMVVPEQFLGMGSAPLVMC